MPAQFLAETRSYKALFEEQLPLIFAAKRGDPEALEQLERMSRHLRRSKAQKFLPNRHDLHEDAMQAAWTGVLNSLRKWDPSWKRLFLAYAHWDISEAIRQFKYEMELTVSRPTHMYRKLAKLTKFGTSDVDELSRLTGLSSESVKGIMAIKQGDLPLHQFKTDSDEEIDDSYSLAPNNDMPPCPLKEMDKADFKRLLDQAMSVLDEKEAHVILLYYHTDSTFGQIAETMNLTRQRVEQININALLKLQKFFIKKDPALAISIKKGKISTPKECMYPKKRGKRSCLKEAVIA
ncbi:MAG: sigma-70 family RNA polymerase sigma factor [Verrucomicrobiota bacterium]